MLYTYKEIGNEIKILLHCNTISQVNKFTEDSKRNFSAVGTCEVLGNVPEDLQ